ncbi:hypothetical protein ACMD2_11235 [Ananas comosus]|uniref:Uncharacterized protein n=1 Tax=Ananas comosus TaxID=4615 RepID=A0A199V0N2_ANACO|nr:hypothetical protein ACMD2_11235 [Ananas comosus]
MARRSSGGRSAPRAAPRAAPLVRPHLQLLLRVVDLFSEELITIAQGMAFGTGSAMAHRAVDAVMGPRTIQHETVATEATAAAATPMGNAVGSDACGSTQRLSRLR